MSTRVGRNWMILLTSFCILGSGSALSALVWSWVPTAIATSIMGSILSVGLVSNNFDKLFLPKHLHLDKPEQDEELVLALILLLEELEVVLLLLYKMECDRNEKTHIQ